MTKEPDAKDVSIEFITPEDAAAYLEFNTHNRAPKARKIAAFSRDMKEGNWLWNGETIKFDREQNLIDGQNRLTAVVDSGKGQWFLVVYNVDRPAQATIDTGTARTFGDTLRMLGYGDCNRIAGATRLLYLWKRGSRNFRSAQETPTINELLEAFKQNPRILDVLADARRLNQKTTITPSTSLFLYVLLTEINETDAKEFFDKLMTLEALPGTSPILQLHNALARLDKRSAGQSSYLMDAQIALTIKAWNKYRQGVPCAQLRFSSGGANPEPFPEPI